MAGMLIKATGRLRITRLRRDLSPDAIVFEDENLITNIGKQTFSRMLGDNPSSSGGTVGGVAFGTISEIAVARMEIGNNPGPTLPASTDTAVGYAATVATPYPIPTSTPYPNFSVAYPDDYSVTFSMTVPAGLASYFGVTYPFLTQEALYLRNGALFARRVFQVGYDGTFPLKFDHTISFA